MDFRTTTSGRRDRATRARHRPPFGSRRTGLYLGVAAAGALAVTVLIGTEPAEQVEAGAGPSETVSVAQQLGLTAASAPVGATPDLQPLEQLAASRSTRETAQTAAQQVQAAADQAVLDRQRAEAEAAAETAARAAAEAAVQQQAAEQQTAEAAAEQQTVEAAAEPQTVEAAPSVVAGAVARISNSAGKVKPQAQAAADAVVSHVPGAGGITIGGTRASATDPGGHPSGLALDYMVGSNDSLGDAIVQYHIAHWNELGVEYVIWQQRILTSPNGSWKQMADRGGATANHMDHPHVNYRG
jgi:hypothetical protein